MGAMAAKRHKNELHLRVKCPWRMVVCFVLVGILLAGSHASLSANGSGDVLIYAVNDNAATTYLRYDPGTGSRTEITTLAGFRPFIVSVEGRLALSSNYWGYEGARGAEGVTVIGTDGQRIQVNAATLPYGSAWAWSPDGQLLAFTAGPNNEERDLFVWDGRAALPVFPEGGATHAGLAWMPGPDNRLAAIEWYSYGRDSESGDIFLWDERTTVNLSQDLEGIIRDAAWRPNELGSQLAFLHGQDGAYSLLVWDGVSAPTPDNFTEVAPDVTGWFSNPVWTPTGSLAFRGQGPDDTHQQIYLWDGQTVTNISQKPDLHNGSPVWSADGRWAFVTFFSPEQLITVRNVDNRTIAELEGQYTPAWSSDGYLAFCRYGENDWQLHLWDGTQTILLDQGYEVWAQWQQSGAKVGCTSG